MFLRFPSDGAKKPFDSIQHGLDVSASSEKKGIHFRNFETKSNLMNYLKEI